MKVGDLVRRRDVSPNRGDIGIVVGVQNAFKHDREGQHCLINVHWSQRAKTIHGYTLYELVALNESR